MFEEASPKSIRMFMSLFVGEICEKATFCLGALQAVENELKSNKRDLTSVFFHLKTSLMHSSGISLALWPVKTTSMERGQLLRSGLNCKDTIDYFKDRKFRNHLSHMDERLDHWWMTSSNHLIARNNIGGKNSISGIDPSDEFERLDPSTGKFLFRGDVFSLPEFAHHCSEIYSATKVLSDGTWWDEAFISAFPLD